MADPTDIPPSPGGKPMGRLGISIISVYFVLMVVLVINGLIVLWPPGKCTPSKPTASASSAPPAATTPAQIPATTPTPPPAGGTPAPTPPTTPTPPPAGTPAPTRGVTPTPASTPAAPTPAPAATLAANDACDETSSDLKSDIFWIIPVPKTSEQRLLLIVMFAGALGALVHALRSFFWYTGNRKLVSSWSGMFVTLPILGAALATVFFLVIRGGLFPQAKVSDTSPIGFVAMAALIGMFTEQAAQKLQQIAETIFAPAPKGADHAGPPTVTGVVPNKGPLAGGTSVTISGTGFDSKATVKFGGVAAPQVTVNSPTSITAQTPPATAAGQVAIEVTTGDGQKASLDKAFTYE